MYKLQRLHPFSSGYDDEVISEVQKVVANTRGKYREQVCRTPLVEVSQKKLNLLANLIKGLDVDKAMVQLMFTQKGYTQEILWALKEGSRIAKDIQGHDPKDLYVAWTMVCRGPTTKSQDIKGRGRAGVKHAMTSFMVIMLREKAAREAVKAQQAKDAVKVRHRLEFDHVPNARI